MKTDELLAMATEFHVGRFGNIPDHITNVVKVIRCEGHRLPKQPYMWKVEWCGSVLSKLGQWEQEPWPSNRNDRFYSRFRFDTLEDAFKAATKAVKKGHPLHDHR